MHDDRGCHRGPFTSRAGGSSRAWKSTSALRPAGGPTRGPSFGSDVGAGVHDAGCGIGDGGHDVLAVVDHDDRPAEPEPGDEDLQVPPAAVAALDPAGCQQRAHDVSLARARVQVELLTATDRDGAADGVDEELAERVSASDRAPLRACVADGALRYPRSTCARRGVDEIAVSLGAPRLTTGRTSAISSRSVRRRVRRRRRRRRCWGRGGVASGGGRGSRRGR